MLAMGCQDVDLVKRMWLIGGMEHRSGNHSFTVSNRPEESKRFLCNSGAKQKRKEKGQENDEKSSGSQHSRRTWEATRRSASIIAAS